MPHGSQHRASLWPDQIDPCKHPEAKVFSSAEQQALLDAALNSYKADSKQVLRGARMQIVRNVEHANADFEVFPHQICGPLDGTWLACTPDLLLVS